MSGATAREAAMWKAVWPYSLKLVRESGWEMTIERILEYLLVDLSFLWRINFSSSVHDSWGVFLLQRAPNFQCRASLTWFSFWIFSWPLTHHPYRDFQRSQILFHCPTRLMPMKINFHHLFSYFESSQSRLTAFRIYLNGIVRFVTL